MKQQTTFLNPSLKAKLSHWQQLFNRIKSEHSFGKIKTWLDYLLAIGYDRGTIEYVYSPEQLSSPISFQTLKYSMECLKLRMEMSEWHNNIDGVAEAILTQPIDHEYPIGNFYRTDTRDENLVRDSHKESDYHDTLSRVTEEVASSTVSLPPSDNQNCTLFHFQERAAAELLDGIISQDKKAQLLIAGAGLGKTYIIGAVVRRILDSGFLNDKTISPWPIILVTRAPIVIQTIRVLEDKFNIDTINECIVINIEQLRSRFGELFVKEQTAIVNGEPVIKFVWRHMVFPAMILLDECQSVMRPTSIQSQILQSYNDIPSPHKWQIYFSATPFTKVSQAKCFAVATGLRTRYTSYVGNEVPLTNENWHTYAINVASPSDPDEHNEAAVERLMKDLLPYVVDVKGVRPQFKVHNRVEIIKFETEEDQKFYEEAWERWQRDKARIEGEALVSGGSGQMAILAAYTKFCQAAEYCRRYILARRAYHAQLEGFAPVIACRFKTTITAVVKILCTEYKVPRSKISLIWGGKSESKSKALKKKELRESLSKHADFLAELQKMGASLKELGLTGNDIAELMDEEAEKLNSQLNSTDLRLGMQSKKDRQEEIDRFQSGKSDYCLFTTKAGGVGLSLHHCDDLSPIKVKRKKDSNWAVLEDIPNVPIKPRKMLGTPVYSAVELVQMLGRCGRLTSLSDTEQTLLFFADTIEVDVAASVSQKLKCLKKVVRQKEHWEEVILASTTNRPHHSIGAMDWDWEDVKSVTTENDDNTLLGGGDDDEEDDDE